MLAWDTLPLSQVEVELWNTVPFIHEKCILEDKMVFIRGKEIHIAGTQREKTLCKTKWGFGKPKPILSLRAILFVCLFFVLSL